MIYFLKDFNLTEDELTNLGFFDDEKKDRNPCDYRYNKEENLHTQNKSQEQ